jgi:hypothetical protein
VADAMRPGAILAALAISAGAPARSDDGAHATDQPRLDCRYSRADETNPERPGPLEGVLLPDTDVFRPILADQREPRFYADYRRVHFRGSDLLAEGRGTDIDVALVAFGGEFGLWGLRQQRGCDGLQVSLFGVVFAQFNLDARSADLLNADYLVGPVVTYRSGRWSGRLRFYHQSSHLGDEFLLNYGIANGVQRQNFSFELVDLILSVEDTWWRVFAGGGLVVLSNSQPDLTGMPGILQWGLELRGPSFGLRNSTIRPVLGASFSSLQATSWSVNGSIEGGLEWASPTAAHRIRALAVAQRGSLPFSQFFFEKTQNVGFQLQFEY